MKKTIYGSMLMLLFAIAFSNQYMSNQKLDAQNYNPSENSIINLDNQNTVKEPGGPIMYSSFSDNFNLNDRNNWFKASGNWSYIPYGLQGGINGKNESLSNNTLLSPAVSSNQSVISTSFRVYNLDDNVSNYASIVNSFRNLNNYQQAGINIYNGTVYVLFSKFVNGTQVNYPEWPGIQTSLKWNPGTLYIMSLATKGTTQDLIINGTKYTLHNEGKINSNGYAGLSYGRIKDIVFYTFALQNYPKK